MTVFGYTRVSTEQQAREGVSLDEQQRQIGMHAQQDGLRVDRMLIEEGVSGSIPLGRRPKGAELLAAVQPSDVVLACKLDRMFRDTRDALRTIKLFKRRGIRLYLLDLPGEITSDIVSQMLFTIVAAFAEFERARISERVREAKAELRRQGKALGGRPSYGWKRRNGKDIEVPEQQATIKEICGLAARGISRKQLATRFGFSKNRIKTIILRATNPAKLVEINANRNAYRERRRREQETDGPANHRTPAKPKTFGEAVAAYVQAHGFDSKRRRWRDLVAGLGDRLLPPARLALTDQSSQAGFEEQNWLSEDDLRALANHLRPNGSPTTKNREVLGPAHAVLHHAARLGWTAPRDRRRGVLFTVAGDVADARAA
jgi:DNA invertase Pin-like site-specific DNA recombinase